MPPCFIFINGYPGVGKHTVANELSKLCQNARVFSDHLLTDLAAAVLDKGDSSYPLLVERLRTDVLGAMSDAISSSNETWILTDFQLNDDAGIAAVGGYRRVAGRLPFISVVLRCERGEHLRRAAETGKLDEVKGLLEVEYGEDIYYSRGGHRRELDVTHLVPGEAARRIHAFVNGVIAGAGSGS